MEPELRPNLVGWKIAAALEPDALPVAIGSLYRRDEHRCDSPAADGWVYAQMHKSYVRVWKGKEGIANQCSFLKRTEYVSRVDVVPNGGTWVEPQVLFEPVPKGHDILEVVLATRPDDW